MTVRIAQHAHAATVTFDYDPEAVDIVKTIAGRQWDSRQRHWTIAASSVPLAAKRFTHAGFTVLVDGRPWTPTAALNGTSVFPALFAYLPTQLRGTTYKALARVLHPDVGGDNALMQALNDAYKETTP